jgi:hypothetical protein
MRRRQRSTLARAARAIFTRAAIARGGDRARFARLET